MEEVVKTGNAAMALALPDNTANPETADTTQTSKSVMCAKCRRPQPESEERIGCEITSSKYVPPRELLTHRKLRPAHFTTMQLLALWRRVAGDR